MPCISRLCWAHLCSLHAASAGRGRKTPRHEAAKAKPEFAAMMVTGVAIVSALVIPYSAPGGKLGAPLNFEDVTAQRIVPTVPEADGPHVKEVDFGDFDHDDDLVIPDYIQNAIG